MTRSPSPRPNAAPEPARGRAGRRRTMARTPERATGRLGAAMGGCFGPQAGPRPTVADAVNHPSHYTSHPAGCIDVVEWFGFNVGNAIKYLWRAGLKGDAVEDLKKARWYCERELLRVEKMRAKGGKG